MRNNPYRTGDFTLVLSDFGRGAIPEYEMVSFWKSVLEYVARRRGVKIVWRTTDGGKTRIRSEELHDRYAKMLLGSHVPERIFKADVCEDFKSRSTSELIAEARLVLITRNSPFLRECARLEAPTLIHGEHFGSAACIEREAFYSTPRPLSKILLECDNSSFSDVLRNVFRRLKRRITKFVRG